jgi:hypothetical protein
MEEREEQWAWHGKHEFHAMTAPDDPSGDILHELDPVSQTTEHLRCEEQESSELLKRYLHGLEMCAGKRKTRRNISQRLTR